MVAFIIGAILLFVVLGLTETSGENYGPLFPEGMSPFFAAIGSFYFSYIGITAITELGGEIKNPKRTLPLALGISNGLAAMLYTALVFTLVGVENWQQLGQMDAAVAEASQLFLPAWMTTLVTLGSIVAIATTVNATFAALSRTIMRAGREGALPKLFGRRHERFDTPLYALLLIGIPSLVLVGLDPGLPFVSTVSVLVILLTNFLLGLALYRLPDVYPMKYRNADLRISEPVLKVLIAVGLLVTFAFGVMTAVGSFIGTAVTVSWLVLGLGVYVTRRRKFAGTDDDLEKTMSAPPELDGESS
nr:APC family permease [Natronococcus occultus]